MSDLIFYGGIVVAKTPVWVYVVFVLLCVLGVRRTTARPTTAFGLAVTPAVFLSWSMVGALAFGRSSGALLGSALWLICLTVGLISFRVAAPPRGEWIDEQRYVRDPSLAPLAVYMSLFVFRYGLEVWAGFVPEQGRCAHALALTVSGFMAGRTTGDLWFAMKSKRPAARAD